MTSQSKSRCGKRRPTGGLASSVGTVAGDDAGGRGGPQRRAPGEAGGAVTRHNDARASRLTDAVGGGPSEDGRRCRD